MIKNNPPVLLVHGWKSSPKIWKKLTEQKELENKIFWNFSHFSDDNNSPAMLAQQLKEYISNMQALSDYSGPFDIVCHSMGTSIVRYLLEVIDGEKKKLKVRQIIALGPPNNGSSMAELFNDQVLGNEIIQNLTGVFVPRGYNPKKDNIVQNIRPESRFVAEINNAGIRDDILYRLIIVVNKTKSPQLFPLFNGMTWDFTKNKEWERTYSGDGIISFSDSCLPGAGYDLFPVNDDHFSMNTRDYCHIRLPGNHDIIKRVVQYLCKPETEPYSYF